jgi:hypothetical protein
VRTWPYQSSIETSILDQFIAVAPTISEAKYHNGITENKYASRCANIIILIEKIISSNFQEIVIKNIIYYFMNLLVLVLKLFL